MAHPRRGKRVAHKATFGGMTGVIAEVVADPDCPRRSVRRARRVDPVLALLASGALTIRQAMACEQLRGDLEAAVPRLPAAAAAAPIHAAPWARAVMADRQVGAWQRARQALDGLTPWQRQAVLWLALGGSMDGFVAQYRCCRLRALRGAASGLEILDGHYDQPTSKTRSDPLAASARRHVLHAGPRVSAAL